MSLPDLSWYRVPVPPEALGSASSSLHHLILTALNLGDPFEQATKISLRRDPVVLTENSHAAAYLRGALMAMPYWPDYLGDPRNHVDQRGTNFPEQVELARELRAFLAQLDDLGELLIGVGE